MSKFNVGDKVVRLSTGSDVFDRQQEKLGLFVGKVYTIKKCNINSNSLHLEELCEDHRWCIDNFKLYEEEDMNKQFTKDMLVAGKHVVELRNGHKAVFIGNGIFQYIDNIEDWMDVDKYSYDLFRPSNNNYTVIRVYEVDRKVAIGSFNRILNPIWQREEKSQQQIEYENLMTKIAELQKQAEKLKPV